LPFVRIRLVAPRPKPCPEHPQTLGEHIKKRRFECGLTQRQTAAQLGVNASTILNWETGRYEPPVRSMPAIFRFLGYYPFAEAQSIGERLLRKRREGGWSICEAARHLGVDPTAWGNWESGELILLRVHRTRLARFLGVDETAVQTAMRARWNAKHPR
jgi:transcriptional regulator with XRE-family HTH domain